MQGGASAEQEDSEKSKAETLAAPKLGKIRSKAARITGTAVTGSTVYVKIGSKTFKVKCKKKKFTLEVPKKYRKKLKKGTIVKAYSKKSGFKKSATVKKKVSA